jgi:hypothetical protein
VEILIYICIGLVIGFVLGKSRSYTYLFQNRSEERLSCAIKEKFQSPDYHLLNHVTLRLGDDTTQIDHILISKFGIFVIETKDYKGWIFANEWQANWTQVLFHYKFKFQNPIFQNLRHVRAVQELLDFLSPNIIKSVVVFMGEAEFKTEIPAGVFGLSEFIEYIQEQKSEVMSLNRVQFSVGRLETARLTITRETDLEHHYNLERRRGSASSE